MSESVHYLDKNTARLITSNQIIQSPYNVVKELVENSLDAHATSIEIRLDNFGFDKIEVKDNGRGIQKSDIACMFLPGHSSKLKEFSDIESLSTYGFRGEALGALCCVANCTVTSKTENDNVAQCYKFDSSGNILESKPSHLGQGTTVSVSQLFCHQPARRRMLLSGRGGAAVGSSKSVALSHIRSYLGAIGVVWPYVRISLIHNGSLVWRKQPVPSTSENPLITAFGETLGHAHAANFQHLSAMSENSINLNILVPKVGCGIREICQSTKAGMIIILNKRIIRHKKIENVLMQHLSASFPEIGRNKYPACVLDLTIDTHDVDINLEPDKSKILINAEKESTVLEEINKLLISYYGKEIHKVTKRAVLHEDNNITNLVSESASEEPKAKKTKIDTDSELTFNKNEKLIASQANYTIEIVEADNRQVSVPTLLPKDDLVKKPPSVQSEITILTADNISSHLPSSTIPENVSKSHQMLDDNVLHSKTMIINSVESSVQSNELELLCESESNELSAANSPATSLSKGQISQNHIMNQSSPQTSHSISSSADINIIEHSVSELDTSFELSEEERDALLELEKLNEHTNIQAPIKMSTTSESLQKSWSRGHVATNDDILESCSMLTPAVIPVSNIGFNSEDVGSPSSQMGCQELAGFSLFCKEIRPQILQAEPGIIFTTVAQTLARRWKELPSVEKERYGELAKQYKQAKKQQLVHKIASPQIQKITQKKRQKKEKMQIPNATVTESDTNSKPHEVIKTVSSKPKKKEVGSSFDLSCIEKSKLTVPADTSDEQFVLIGKVKNCWLLKQRTNVALMCPWVLYEVLIMEHLKGELVLPVIPLDCQLTFSSREIGWKCWQTLSKLDSKWNVISNSTEVISPLITNNGFQITINNDSCDQGNATITKIASSIPGYGIQDLQEILTVINNNPNCTLAQSRPKAVLKYIEERASKSAQRIFEKPLNSLEVSVLLNQWALQELNISHCHHGQQIYIQLSTTAKDETSSL